MLLSRADDILVWHREEQHKGRKTGRERGPKRWQKFHFKTRLAFSVAMNYSDDAIVPICEVYIPAVSVQAAMLRSPINAVKRAAFPVHKREPWPEVSHYEVSRDFCYGSEKEAMAEARLRRDALGSAYRVHKLMKKGRKAIRGPQRRLYTYAGLLMCLANSTDHWQAHG